MSSEIGKQLPSGKPDKVIWRSLEQKADPERLREQAGGSDIVKQHVDLAELTKLRRRNFLTLSGAISAFAGLPGCIRRPAEKIMPYTEAPADVTVGVPSHYATVMNSGGEALGLLVLSHEGRPTKIEGNPEHPSSQGTTDLRAQASVLDLYDGDRSRAPSHKGAVTTYAEFEKAFEALAAAHAKDGGNGLRVLAEPTLSPSFVRLRGLVKQRLPGARFHTYAPISDANAREGTRIAFGQPLSVNLNLGQARVIVALDSDFLGSEPGHVQASRHFAESRHLSSGKDTAMSRLYAVEPCLTLTGSNADHRLALPAAAIGQYAQALAAALAKHGMSLGTVATAVAEKKVDGVPAKWIDAVAKDLADHKGAAVVVVGSRQPPAVHALAAAMNLALGSAGRLVTYTQSVDPEQAEPISDLRALAGDMAAGRVKTLVILSGNPVYTAPADLKFAEALAKVPTSITLSTHLDETAAVSTWHVPGTHYLESWGDQVSRGGYYAVQQPLISPLFEGRSDLELLAALAGSQEKTAHDIARTTAGARGYADPIAWQLLVQRGIGGHGTGVQTIGANPVLEDAVASAVRALPAATAPTADAFELVFLADNKLFDGRHANNAWLQELPDPITRITWDNVALIRPSTAEQLGIANGDMIKLTVDGRSVDIAAWKQPGQAPHSIGVALGWGRKLAGRHAVDAGFDVYPLRSSSAPHFVSGVKVEKLGKSYKISQTQDHDYMEGRPLAIDATLAEYGEQPDFGQWRSPNPSTPPLWKVQDYSEGHKWGMVIDLNRCSGCNACAVACQAENNVPTVGKDQVSRGREMHWLRIDRYYVGEDKDLPDVAFQPVACQHCEQAPCENVCPVNATAHSPEGLNDIAYNRCIGTRYCMNNCPYKVRRFNFLNFNNDIPDTQKMVYNPNVTLRFRGVVEKCSYCVQRIQNGKIAAKRDGRQLKDGDVVSACAQACPAQAITFGDLNDSNSKIAKLSQVDRNYQLLAEVGTHPRTTFLGKIRNPNPEMETKG